MCVVTSSCHEVVEHDAWKRVCDHLEGVGVVGRSEEQGREWLIDGSWELC